jgi:hypothetical protein
VTLRCATSALKTLLRARMKRRKHSLAGDSLTDDFTHVEAAITRLVGAVLLEQNDVYGPPPLCKGFRLTMANTALAVVYPALKRGDTAAGPDGFRGSTAGQMDELGSNSHHFIDLCRTRSDRFAIISRHPRKPTPHLRRSSSYTATTAARGR